MKRTDPKFLETFIILHDEDGEIIIRKDIIHAIYIDHDSFLNGKATCIDCGSEGVHHVEESIDEVLELL